MSRCRRLISGFYAVADAIRLRFFDSMRQVLPVIFLMGPTATGKTDLAAALSADFPVELISVDAAQVYRGMDIGTAKPAKEFLSKYPHHLIDIRDPESVYSAAEFCSDARQLIEQVRGRERIPLFVGGTMFYFRALEYGLSELPAADQSIRDALTTEIEESGVGVLYQRLRRIDPELAARIDRNDSQRVQRALEIFHASGRVPSNLMLASKGLPDDPIKLAIFSADRGALHTRIAMRFKAMLEHGLVEEVTRLYARPELTRTSPSMRIVGYRQVIDFLENDITFSQLAERGVAATRQLAKRQLTWMRQQSGLVWFEAGQIDPSDAMKRYLENRIRDSRLI